MALDSVYMVELNSVVLVEQHSELNNKKRAASVIQTYSQMVCTHMVSWVLL